MNVPGYSTTATKLCESRAGRVARALACLALSGALSSTGGAWGAGVPAKTSATAATIAEGTILHLRLQTTVSTMTSKKGQPVAAVIAREVIAQGGVAVPVGATLKGSIEKCSNPSQADERAELLLNFTELDIPGEGNLKLSGHVSGVGNARETLLADGTIVGVLKTEAPVTLLGGVLQKLGDSNPTIAKEIQKQKIGEVNTAIDLPAGTDLQFTLAQPLSVPQLVSVASSKRLPSDLSAFLASFLSEAPQRSVSKDNKPGDPINLIVVGRSQEIAQAFRQAGWSEPKRRDGQSILETARAVMNNEGYGAAPISDLYVYQHKQDLAFEKMLNTFNKRHHLRLWQTPAHAPDGRPVWVGAATHDTGLDIHPGVVSHATDPDLDDERDQVNADFASTQAAVELVARPNPLTSGMTATGGAWHTDGRLLVIDLKPGASADTASK